MKLDKFQVIIKETPADVQEHVKLSMDILDRIHELLEKKFDGKQKLLAEKMNKSEAEISKWLSGVQNFTTKTLVKLQIAFGEPIITVCSNNKNNSFIPVKIPCKKTHAKLLINRNGVISEKEIIYKNILTNNFKRNFRNDLPA